MRELWRQRWAFVPVILLGSTVAFTFVTVRLALRDHGTAAEPDYYRKALAWNEVRARREAGEWLRWVISPSLTRPSASTLAIELVVSDRHGLPIDGAEVRIEAIPIRAADTAQHRTATELSPGRYHAEVPIRVGGQWEFRVEVQRGEHHVADSFRRLVAPPRAPAGGAATASVPDSPRAEAPAAQATRGVRAP